MNTKVNSGPNIKAMLDGLDRATLQLTGDIRRESRACLSTVSYYIAQQDATIARLREALATIRDSTFRNATTLRGMADYTLTQEKSP